MENLNLDNIMASLEAIVELMNGVIKSHSVGIQEVQRFKESIEEVREDVARVNQTLYTGNGKDPITVRMASVELAVSNMKDKFDHLETDAEYERQSNIAAKKSRWAMLVALVSAVAAIASAVIPKL